MNTSRSKLESETDATADGLSTLGRPWKSGHVLRVQGGEATESVGQRGSAGSDVKAFLAMT